MYMHNARRDRPHGAHRLTQGRGKKMRYKDRKAPHPNGENQ